MNEHKAYDPAKELGDKLYKSPHMFPDDGVAGRNDVTNQNEKAMLEHNLAKVTDKVADLAKPSHPRMGIYGDGNTN